MDKTGIVSLLQSPHIWRLGSVQRLERTGLPTGIDWLDAALPDGGWPAQGLTELMCDQQGVGEVSLLLPALAALSIDHPIAWINPPCLPYAPALLNAGLNLSRLLVVQPNSPADSLWAAEQSLRSGSLGAVLIWLKQHTDYATLRRLHLAAESGGTAAFLFQSTAFARQPSPAPLRLMIGQERGGQTITIFKARGLISAKKLNSLAQDGNPAHPKPAIVSH